MEDLQLSEALQRYFSDIFLCCDEENSGKASVSKAVELIKSGNVPEEVVTQVNLTSKKRATVTDPAFLSQISDICWSQNSGHLNRKQLYSALKLVAAYQANIPIGSELVTMAVELPMPRFSWMNNKSPSPIPDLIELSTSELNEYRKQGDVSNTDSEVDSETLGPGRTGSPEVSSAASDSPTPTNSVQDRSWAVSGAWQGLVSEEQRQLLGEL